jgi:glycine dehydrogenase subunit 2
MIKEVREPLIFEISESGKRASELPTLDVPARKDLLAGVPLRGEIEDFPEVSETEITRHFTRLSQKNYCVDMGIYPLGSCTMKYNPKINERLAAHPAFAASHPPGRPCSGASRS